MTTARLHARVPAGNALFQKHEVVVRIATEPHRDVAQLHPLALLGLVLVVNDDEAIALLTDRDRLVDVGDGRVILVRRHDKHHTTAIATSCLARASLSSHT